MISLREGIFFDRLEELDQTAPTAHRLSRARTKRACELSSGELATCVGTLAAAYAEVGEFEAASDTQRKAIGMLSTKDTLMETYRSRLALYVSHKPCREATNY